MHRISPTDAHWALLSKPYTPYDRILDALIQNYITDEYGSFPDTVSLADGRLKYKTEAVCMLRELVIKNNVLDFNAKKERRNPMNALQVFNSDIIPVYTTDTGEKVVIGQELHSQLKIVTRYADWFPRMCEYGFVENLDYESFSQKGDKPQGGRPSINHILKLDMAKHIAMIQRTPEGFAIRQKLIELEKQTAALTSTDLLELQVKALRDMERKQAEAAKAIAETTQAVADTNARIDNMKDAITLSTASWREDCRKLIVRIAQAMGGNDYIREVQAEIFRLVDERAGVSLNTRLTNLRRRMAEEGVCKSKRDKMNKVDVIAGDKKLIEIYTAIVKEMAVKHLDKNEVA